MRELNALFYKVFFGKKLSTFNFQLSTKINAMRELNARF